MAASADESRPRPSAFVWIAASTAALALVLWHVAAAGTWLDEYWQLWISGAPAEALPGRLAADAHPPWFNLLARLWLAIAGGEVVPARVVSLAGALAVLGAGLAFLSGLDRAVRWRILLLTVASSGPAGLAILAASFRVYPWLLVLAVLQASILLAVAARSRAQPQLAAIVTAVSITAHYVHAAGAIAVAIVTIFLAWRRGERPLAGWVLAGLAGGVALDVATGLFQLSHWRANVDVNWIAASGGGGPETLAVLVGGLLLFNIVAAVLLLLALIRGRLSGPVRWLAVPVPIAAAAWLALDSVTTMLVPRYLVTITALMTVAAAAAWRDLGLKTSWNAVAAAAAALQPLWFNWTGGGSLPGWDHSARLVAALSRRCPGSQVYAVSPWRFREGPDGRSAAFERPVVRFAYDRVGSSYGLKPYFVERPIVLPLGDCPAIIWIEAARGIERTPAATVLARAQLQVSGPAEARFVPTPNGSLLLISATDRLQRRQ